MDASLFDADSFVAFCEYAAQYVAGGFGVTLAFWLVAHAIGRILDQFEGV